MTTEVMLSPPSKSLKNNSGELFSAIDRLASPMPVPNDSIIPNALNMSRNSGFSVSLSLKKVRSFKSLMRRGGNGLL